MLHYRHWKISDNVEHQIREDGQFGKVKCSFVGNVYQYEPECHRSSSQVRKIHIIIIMKHALVLYSIADIQKETGTCSIYA